MLSIITLSGLLAIASYKLGAIPLILTERCQGWSKNQADLAKSCAVWLLVNKHFPVTTNTLRYATYY